MNKYNKSLFLFSVVGLLIPILILVFSTITYSWVSNEKERRAKFLKSQKEDEKRLEEVQKSIKSKDVVSQIQKKMASSSIRNDFNQVIKAIEVIPGLSHDFIEINTSFDSTSPFPSLPIFASDKITLDAKCRFVTLERAAFLIEKAIPNAFLSSMLLNANIPPSITFNKQAQRGEWIIQGKLEYTRINPGGKDVKSGDKK